MYIYIYVYMYVYIYIYQRQTKSLISTSHDKYTYMQRNLVLIVRGGTHQKCVVCVDGRRVVAHERDALERLVGSQLAHHFLLLDILRSQLTTESPM